MSLACCREGFLVEECMIRRPMLLEVETIVLFTLSKYSVAIIIIIPSTYQLGCPALLYA